MIPNVATSQNWRKNEKKKKKKKTTVIKNAVPKNPKQRGQIKSVPI